MERAPTVWGPALPGIPAGGYFSGYFSGYFLLAITKYSPTLSPSPAGFAWDVAWAALASARACPRHVRSLRFTVRIGWPPHPYDHSVFFVQCVHSLYLGCNSAPRIRILHFRSTSWGLHRILYRILGRAPYSVFRIRIPYPHFGAGSVFRIPYPYSVSAFWGGLRIPYSVSVFRIRILGWTPYSVFRIRIPYLPIDWDLDGIPWDP